MKPDPAIAQTAADFSRLDGQPVIATGHYQAVERPMKGRVRKEMPKDRALLRLDDGTQVYLESLDSKKSRRPPGELKRFDGCRVRVYGTAHSIMPARGESLISPCLTEVSEILEAGPVRK